MRHGRNTRDRGSRRGDPARPRRHVGGGTADTEPFAGEPAGGGPAGGLLVEDGRANGPPVQQLSAHLALESVAAARRVTRRV